MGAQRNPGEGRETETPQHGRQGQQMEKSQNGHRLSSNLILSIFQEEGRCEDCLEPRFEHCGLRRESLLPMASGDGNLLPADGHRCCNFILKIVSIPAEESTTSRTHHLAKFIQLL